MHLLLPSRVGVGSGQPSGNEGTQRGPHHMYVSGRAETVDWSQKPLLCSQYEHIEARGTHEKEGVCPLIYTCVLKLHVCVRDYTSLIQKYTPLFMDILYMHIMGCTM